MARRQRRPEKQERHGLLNRQGRQGIRRRLKGQTTRIKAREIRKNMTKEKNAKKQCRQRGTREMRNRRKVERQ